jgi:GntR family transcriptional regulator, transcriptional repressor for pyruvate dehydrogenase complex
MGVSRSTLREALRALSILNILEMRQGDGTYITSLDLDLLVEPLDLFLTMDSPTLAQLFEVRKMLEVGTAGLAATRITPAEIEGLKSCLEHALANVDDPDAFLQADIELHEGIARATDNPILTRFVVSLRVLGKASRERTVGIPGVVESTIVAHGRLVEAIGKGDAAGARQAMKEHLEQVELSLQSLYFSEQQPA